MQESGLEGGCFQPLYPNCVINSQSSLMAGVVVLAGDGGTCPITLMQVEKG